MSRWRFIALLALMPGAAPAASAPAGLLGRSVVIGWTDSVVRTAEGQSIARTRNWAHELRIYISSAGRPFSRLQSNAFGPRNRAAAASDQGPGDTTASRGEARSVHFEGRALVVVSLLESGARRILVDFDAAYATCTATVIYGREHGATIRQTGLGGLKIQVHSIESSSFSCAVREGNVLTGP